MKCNIGLGSSEAMETCIMVDRELFEKLKAENKRFKKTLEFYAIESNWWDLEDATYCRTRITDEDTYKQDDKASSQFIFGGKLARETLRQLEGEK